MPFEPFARAPSWEAVRDRLDALRALPHNFDPERSHEHTEAAGWHHDRYETDLPPEPPGPPLPDGSWAAARAVAREYRFPDPGLIRGLFVPDDPLPGRPMLLRARFVGFTFWFGVRIGEEVDEERATDDGPARVWGFNYRTLEGHFERGQIQFEVWKYLASGRVVFRVRAYSQLGRIANPLYRVGFRLFGRGLQRRFARTALERMRHLVGVELALRR